MEVARMRRIKLIFAVVAAVAMLMVSAVPAVAQAGVFCDDNGVCTYFNLGMGDFSSDCDWVQGWAWDPDEQEWVPVRVCVD